VKLHTQVKDYSSLKLFDLRSESGHSGLLYQILYKCDLPGEGSPDKECRFVETSVNNNKSVSQDYLHPQDHT